MIQRKSMFVTLLALKLVKSVKNLKTVAREPALTMVKRVKNVSYVPRKMKIVPLTHAVHH